MLTLRLNIKHPTRLTQRDFLTTSGWNEDEQTAIFGAWHF
jgi:hypothetical protein